MRIRTRIIGALSLVAGALLACESSELAGPDDATGLSVAYGRWTPTPVDTCPQSAHDRYAVLGPDGLLYPTWHPPVDPGTGCSFGHEHGRDPRGSDLYDEVGAIPFGVANQALDEYDPSGPRHEDHVGHKIEWENDFELSVGGAAGPLISVRCDVLTKLHQGSHSKDAFTNNLHEVVYHIRCSDNAGFSVTFLTPIGPPGEFRASCDRDRVISAGPPTPANSPSGGGRRSIPDRACVEQHILKSGGAKSNFGAGLRESWEISGRIRREDGRTLVSFNPYYQVIAPSRFYDPTRPGNTGRPIDVCYEITSDGRRAEGGLCESSTANGSVTGVSFDDPRSAFKGVQRFVDINANRVTNASGPEVWYTDPFGHHARPAPFAGSLRQWVARADNSTFDTHGPVIGRDRSKQYGGPTVHAPN